MPPRRRGSLDVKDKTPMGILRIDEAYRLGLMRFGVKPAARAAFP